MKTLKIAAVLSLTLASMAFAQGSGKSNCQAHLNASLDKSKAVKAQDATRTVFGKASAPSTSTNGSKTTR